MKPHRRLLAHALVLAGTISPVVGCALPGGTARIAATHYVDSDRRALPRGPVSGQAKKLCGVFFVNWGAPDAALMRAALDDALADDPQAELLIDAQTDASIYTVPLIFSRCRVFVSGTSATTTPRGEEQSVAGDE